jgi:integrase
LNNDTTQGIEPVTKRVVRDRDGLHKRRGIWHYKLKIAGRWRESSAGTRNYREAKQIRQKALQDQIEGRLPTDAARAKLSQVVPRWLNERRQLRSLNTWKTETHLVKSLLAAMAEKKLCDISTDDIKVYQAARSGSVSAPTVNRELRILRSILKQYKLWARLADEYGQLREDSPGPGRALTPDEERKLFQTAASRPGWEAAYYAALVAANTTARGCELRGLRLVDIDLDKGVVQIRRSTTKTDAGCRVIPLNSTSRWAVARLLERAQTLGASAPEHCLFPACERGRIDVTSPQKTWRTAWRSLTKKAGLAGLRFHDLRHHSITKLAEAGVPDQTLMAIAGHVSREMLEHYSHIRQQAKRDAVEAIDSYRPHEAETTDGVTTAVN